MNNLLLSGVYYRSYNGVDEPARFLVANAGTLRDFELSDFEIDAADEVVPNGGTIEGVVGNDNWDTLFTGFTNTAPVNVWSTGGLPALDVRDLGNKQGSEAYHDGSGTNTEGPAFNNGGGWTSTVDGTTIS